MAPRSLMLVNVLVRLGYGVGGLIAPRRMAGLKLVADTVEHPDARLFVRAFSAHQIAVALLGLAALRRPRLRRPAAAAALAIDGADVVSALAEGLAREGLDAEVTGGALFSAAGAVTAAAALRSSEH